MINFCSAGPALGPTVVSLALLAALSAGGSWKVSLENCYGRFLGRSSYDRGFGFYMPILHNIFI